MKRSTPMKRGGFAYPKWQGYKPREREIQPVVAPTTQPLHRGTYAGSTTGVIVPKNPRLENPHLLLMAREVPRPCLLVVPGLCVQPGADVSCCACHGNGHEWNKGSRMKAHDFFSVWGCARCHNWLDSSYSAEGYERDLAFRRALALQIVHWDVIATNPTGKPKDVDAVRWALQHLIDRGYATLSPHPGQFATPNLQRIHGR